MSFKLIFSHIIITLISIFGISYLYQFIDNRIYEILYASLHLAIILMLYIASGILATDDTFSFKKYYIIALIGFIIWLIAFINSPESIDYKHVKGAGLWFFHQLYVMAISIPFETFLPSQKNVFFNIALLLSYTIIPSLMQAFGGYLKIRQNNKYGN